MKRFLKNFTQKENIRILLVNPNELESVDTKPYLKKEYINWNIVKQAERENIYSPMNLGLLSIATYLIRNDYTNIKIVDLTQFNNPLSEYKRVIEKDDYDVIGLSCNNHTNYLVVKQLARITKEIKEDTLLIAGGSHIGEIPSEALREIPELDVIVRKQGEIPFLKLLNTIRKGEKLSTVPNIVIKSEDKIIFTQQLLTKFDINKVSFLEYTLYPNYKQIIPVVEESRGCPNNCYFCYKYDYSYKKIETLVDEIKRLKTLYPGDELIFVMGAFSFGINKKRTLKLLKSLIKLNFSIKWSTQIRADVIGTYTDEELSLFPKAGLQTLKVGLESANERMLKIMNKTKNPKLYLSSIEHVLDFFKPYKDKMDVRLNILFFPGETPSSIRETLKFICKHSDKIVATHASPLMLYPGTYVYEHFDEFQKKYGCFVTHSDYSDSVHAWPVNISELLTFHRLWMFSDMIRLIF